MRTRSDRAVKDSSGSQCRFLLDPGAGEPFAAEKLDQWLLALSDFRRWEAAGDVHDVLEFFVWNIVGKFIF